LEFGDILTAVGGWGNVGAGTVLSVVIILVLKGSLIGPGLVRREDMDKALVAVQVNADGRVADAHARVKDHERRVDRAEEEARLWRDAWITSESGRRLAAEQTVSVLAATTPSSQVLTPEATLAARSLGTSRQT